jgi:hypothetical protein
MGIAILLFQNAYARAIYSISEGYYSHQIYFSNEGLLKVEKIAYFQKECSKDP